MFSVHCSMFDVSPPFVVSFVANFVDPGSWPQEAHRGLRPLPIVNHEL